MNEKIEEKTETLRPFTKLCMTIGQLPASYVESMSYYEQLLWFTKYLQEQVIPAVNQNAAAVEELQRYFIELQNYVNNYFDNLDVQEEINNKLDAMVEDGTLEHIIASYLQTQKIYNTFDEMVLDASNLVDGLNVQTLGYHSYNDGGGAFYQITDTASLTDYQVQIGTLYATLIINNEMNVKQFGAYGDDSHNDTTALQNALNTCKRITIDNGTYLTNSLTINENQYVKGNNAILHLKDNTENNKIFNITNNNIIIENLYFKCNIALFPFKY